MHYQPFLIAGLPRSGTTLLHTYLNTHPNIHSQGEIHLKALLQPEKIFKPYGQHIHAAGAKLMLPYQDVQTNIDLLKQLLQQFPELKVIFIQRENLLHWYISLQIALKTSQWSQSGNKATTSLTDKQLFIPTDKLLSQLQQAEESIKIYQTVFKKVSLLELSYENLSQNPQDILPEIQDFIGVQPSPLLSLLQKQNPEPLSELILNYEEVSRTLHHTLYGQQLKGE